MNHYESPSTRDAVYDSLDRPEYGFFPGQGDVLAICETLDKVQFMDRDEALMILTGAYAARWGGFGIDLDEAVETADDMLEMLKAETR